MSLITPDFGLFFWMVLAFGLVLVVLRKFAWKPILGGLESRERTIAEGLENAEKHRIELEQWTEQRLSLEAEARKERELFLSEARSQREQLIAEAREQAKEEVERITQQARENMRLEQEAIRRELRNEVRVLVVKTTERILRERLASNEEQERYLDRVIDEMMKVNAPQA
ncbi:MAG: F0F1 ATP synthase subunit B [Bacteroides sp.]|jgi:ATP synthase F0, B subunit